MSLAPEPAGPPPPADGNPVLDWLAQATDLLQGAFDVAPAGLFLADPQGGVRWCNTTWRHLFDVWGPTPVALDQWVHRLVDADGQALRRSIEDAVREDATVDLRLRWSSDPDEAPGLLRVVAHRAVRDDPASGVVGAVTVEGLTGAGEAGGPDDEAWAHRALHDPLTNLPNRLLLQDHLEMALARCERDGSRVALLFFDVDKFKAVNDSQGHEAGDALLCQLAERMTETLRPSDTVARIGGDEFVVLIDGVEDEQDAIIGARRVTQAIETQPYRLPDMNLPVTVSGGVALSRPGISPRALLSEADAAMYRAKERGRARVEIYDEVLRRRAQRRVDLAHHLHEAVERDEMEVHFQPSVDLHTGTVVALEGLVRWPTVSVEGRELLSVAEDSGLIVEIGDRVLRQACQNARDWADGPTDDPPRVHVNLSARQIRAPEVAARIGSVLDETGLEPSSLCLEIPEPALTKDPAAAIDIVASLKELGVQLAIDDFGTAASSLPFLRDLDVDQIKIDGSFVANLGPGPEDAAIVAAITSITRSLGLIAIAEGVETVEQLAELQALGCDVGQGHLFSPAVPEGDHTRFLDHVFAV